MREWIDVVKRMLLETDLQTNNVVQFPKRNIPVSKIAVARGGADVHKLPPRIESLDQFTRGYITAALWSSSDDEGEPLNKHYEPKDIHVNTLENMISDCARFQSEAGKLIALAGKKHHGYSEAYAGADFWLTRNRHGSGFWDQNLGAVGDKLTELAKKFNEVDLTVDDGVIY